MKWFNTFVVIVGNITLIINKIKSHTRKLREVENLLKVLMTIIDTF